MNNVTCFYCLNIASASEELSSQAELLKEQVSRFKLKRTASSYKNNMELSPELRRLLEDMSNKKKWEKGLKEDADIGDTAPRHRIELSDRKFGKY